MGLSFRKLLMSMGRAPATPYLGQVVGQLMQPQTLLAAASASQIMCRKMVYARSAITSVKLRYPNWFLNNSDLMETGSGNDLVITAAIEYPLGATCTQALWSASATQTIANFTNGAESDACVVAIPAGSKFAIRTYATCTVGFPLQNRTGCSDRTFNAGMTRFATSGLSDQTMTPGNPTGGTLTDNYMLQPIVCASTTAASAIAIVGDSRQEGSAASESYSNTSGDIGQIARCIGPTFAYTNFGKGSDSAQKFLAGNALRKELIETYFSHIIDGYGINDTITLSRTAAASYADIQTIRALFPSQKYKRMLLDAYASSSDSFATIVNQTTNARNSVRVAFNDLVTSSPFDGYYNNLTVTENMPNSDGKWVVTGAVNYATTDGVHQSTALNELCRTGNVIPSATIAR